MLAKPQVVFLASLSSRFNRLAVGSLILLLLSLFAQLQQPSARAAEVDITVTCFTETGYCMAGRIKEYWSQNGGLAVFGFPISDQHEELIEGKTYQVQGFQRNRLELHPENARPYDVLLGRLGVVRLEQQGRDWTKFGKSAGLSNSPTCLDFPVTSQTVCTDFLTYFRSHGLEFDGVAGKSYAESLALFGNPISSVTVETNASGDTVQTQWFERARFEFHPNNPDPYKVELGLLGSEIKDAVIKPPATTPPPPPAAPAVKCEGVPANQSGEIYPSTCLTKGSSLWTTGYGFKGGEQVGYWLNSPEGNPVTGTRRTYAMPPNGSGTLFWDTSYSGYYPGIWSVVIESPSTHHQSVIYFKVLDSNDSSIGIAITNINGGNRGSKASLTAHTAPNLGCNLDYYTPIGNRSKAQGLGQKTSDANGNLAWEWFIGTDTNPGTGYVAVTCNGVTVNGRINIG